MIKVVIDTEVYVTALISASGPCCQVVDSWLDGKFMMYSSPEILDEVDRVVETKRMEIRHHINKLGRKRYFKYLKFFSLQTPGELSLNVSVGDSGVSKFLSCGVEAKADFIVSNDSTLLKLGSYEGMRLLSPMDFVEVLTEM